MQHGINSVLFGGHDMEAAFRWAAACGYDAIEVSGIDGMSEHLVLDRWQECVPRVRELSQQYGLPVTAIEHPGHDREKLEAAVKSAEALGCPIVNTGPGGQTGDEESFKESIETLKDRTALAADHGVTLCVKAHVGRCVHDTPTSVRLLETIDHPNFGLDMDPSHVHRAGENPVEAIAAVIARIRHVHIRDCKGREKGPGDPEMQANGRGDIDLLGYVAKLHEHGYSGPLNLEVIGAKSYELPACVAIAAEAKGHMQACLQACGAR